MVYHLCVLQQQKVISDGQIVTCDVQQLVIVHAQHKEQRPDCAVVSCHTVLVSTHVQQFLFCFRAEV